MYSRNVSPSARKLFKARAARLRRRTCVNEEDRLTYARAEDDSQPGYADVGRTSNVDEPVLVMTQCNIDRHVV